MTTLECAHGHSNPVGQEYCSECGQSLGRLCPNGHRNSGTPKFCGACGAPMASEVFYQSSVKPIQSLMSEAGAVESDPVVTSDRGRGISTKTAIALIVSCLAVAVAGLIAVTLGGRGNSGANGSSSGSSSDATISGPSGDGTTAKPTGRGKFLDEQVPAVCRPGSVIENGDTILPNAQAQGSCQSMQGGPIFFGQYGDFSTSKNAVGLFRGAEYAAAASGSHYYVFISVSGSGVLTPLAQLGYTVDTVPTQGF